MILGDNLFPEIVVLWDIILVLIEKDGFLFEVFGVQSLRSHLRFVGPFPKRSMMVAVASVSKLLVLAISHWSLMLMNSQSGNKMMSLHLYMALSCIKTGILPNSLHKCIWAIPDHPKKWSIAMVLGLVRIANSDLLTSG